MNAKSRQDILLHGHALKDSDCFMGFLVPPIEMQYSDEAFSGH